MPQGAVMDTLEKNEGNLSRVEDTSFNKLNGNFRTKINDKKRDKNNPMSWLIS